LEADSPLHGELSKLADQYAHGTSIDGFPTRVPFDVIAPHTLVDALEESARQFCLGWQHDAAELFSHLSRVTGLGAACFRASDPNNPVAAFPRRHEDLLLVDEIEAGSDLGTLVQQDVIDMVSFLQKAMGGAELLLRAVPPALAVRLPQFIEQGGDDVEPDAERTWIQEDFVDDRREVIWGDERVDLTACCSEGCKDRDQAVYRLKAFVSYCNKPEWPALAMSQGHFVAYFREADTWYAFDDLDQDARMRVIAKPPNDYPYLCFLERVGDPEVLPAALQPNATRSSAKEPPPPHRAARGVEEIGVQAAEEESAEKEEEETSDTQCSDNDGEGTACDETAPKRRHASGKHKPGRRRDQEDKRTARGRREILCNAWFDLGA
jgi:hypothetical protein